MRDKLTGQSIDFIIIADEEPCEECGEPLLGEDGFCIECGYPEFHDEKMPAWNNSLDIQEEIQ